MHMSIARSLTATLLACALSGCSAAPDTPELARKALTAMGGAERIRDVRSVVMRGGSGTRWRLGQIATPGGADPQAKLANVTETLDVARGRAALEYDITSASGFSQHRQEVLTKVGDRPIGLENVTPRPLAVVSPSGLFSWGTQNSPAMTLRRNIIAVALAAASADADQRPEIRTLDSKSYLYGTVSMNGEMIGVYFDDTSGLIAAYEATDTETMLGDLRARYQLDDYRSVDGVMLPFRIKITKGDQPYSEVQFTGAAVNDDAALAVLEVPSAAATGVEQALAEGPDFSPVTLMPVGPGVHFAQAYSHHSLVVEFPTFLAVVEAPYTEAQSKTLVKRLSSQFPGKPLRYAAVTHPHFDHTGGVRGIAAAGAAILTARGHEPQLRPLLSLPHTNPADELETRRKTGLKVGALEVFDAKKVISEGAQSLELHAVTGSPHVEPVVLAFVPRAGILFQSDLFFPGTGAAATPAATHLLQAVRTLGLPVRLNAGGHGGVAPFDELVKAVEGRK